jgi:hypothetical protein
MQGRISYDGTVLISVPHARPTSGLKYINSESTYILESVVLAPHSYTSQTQANRLIGIAKTYENQVFILIQYLSRSVRRL